LDTILHITPRRGLISSNAIAADLNARGVAAANGGQWFPMQVRRIRDRLDLSSTGGCSPGVKKGFDQPGAGVASSRAFNSVQPGRAKCFLGL
jgi:hypothetical protein